LIALEFIHLFTSENKKLFLFIYFISFHWSGIVRTEIDWEVITTDLTKNSRHAPAVKTLGHPN